MSHDDVKWLRQVADNVPVNIAYLDAEHRYRFVNENVERHYGLRQEEIIGKHANEILGEDAYRRFLPHIEAGLRGEEVTFEQEISLVDGKQRDYLFTYRPHFAENNEVAGLYIIVVDITDRKRAETELQQKVRESELLRQMAIKANEAATADEAIQACLDEVCAYTGWPVGHAYWVVTDGDGGLATTKQWHLDNPDRYADFRRVTETTRYTSDQGLPIRVVAEAKPQWMVSDTRYQHFPRASARIDAGLNSGFAFPAMAGKNVVTVLEFFSPQAIEPDPQFLSVTTEVGILIGQAIERKLTEQETLESRDQLRLVTDNLPALIVYVDAEQRYQFANKTACEWHARPVEELIGRTASEIHGQEYEKVRSRIENTLAGEQQTYIETITHSDGVTRATRATSVPHRGAAGKILGFFSLVEDITELQRAEEAQRESESHLRAIVDHSPAAIFLKNTDGRFISANRVWHDNYNPTDADITDKTIHDFVPQEVADGAVAVDTKILTTGEPVVEEQYFPSTDGVRQYILSTKFPVRDNGGNIIAIGGVNSDITEHVIAERALRDSEAHLAHAQQIANLGSWVWELDIDKVTWTDALYRLMQIDRETTGNLVDAFYARIHPDDRTKVARIREELIKSGNEQLMAFRIILPNGEERHIHTQWVVENDASGRPVRAIGTTQDVTEVRQSEAALRESEQWLRAVVDNIPATLTLKNPDGTFRYVNKQFCEWYDLNPEQAIGKNGHDLFPNVTADTVDAIDREILETIEAIQAEVPATFADGSQHTLLTNNFLVHSDDGTVIGKGLVGYDVTETKRTEEMLRQAQKMEAIGQLTGGVAHDFNNLLAVVIGNLEMITDHFADTSQVDTPVFDFVRNAFNAAEKGASLTHHLLAFARQQVLQPEEANLAKMISETKDLMSVSMGERVTVKLETDDNLWLCRVDQAQLQNAILNLSINARDAMKGHGELTMSTENVRIDAERAEVLDLQAGDYVCLSVSDNGPGIPEDVLEHVYEPFYTTKDVGEGSGLGLSMVYGFAQQSGGAIDIKSEVGKGTAINLYFPAIVFAAVTAVEEAAQPQDGLTKPDATILLVEDNAAFREVTRTILESLNFRVIDFGSAEEALSVIGDTTPFDLLLSDIGLPGDMNGHDLAEYATSARPGLKTVLMSAHADLRFGGSVIDTNVTAFLPKPHRKAELAQTLRQVL